jgi:hypothetical protein
VSEAEFARLLLYREWKRRGKKTRARGEVTQSPKMSEWKYAKVVEIWELGFVGANF